jgi:hypothetical protein
MIFVVTRSDFKTSSGQQAMQEKENFAEQVAVAITREIKKSTEDLLGWAAIQKGLLDPFVQTKRIAFRDLAMIIQKLQTEESGVHSLGCLIFQ